MDINKAKSITIIFLIILNSFLGVLVYVNRNIHTVSNKSIDEIIKLLNENNLTIDTDIIKKYKPMKDIKIRYVTLDSNNLKLHFDNISNNEGTYNYLYGNEITYLNEIENFDLTEDNALKIGNKYIFALDNIINNLYLDKIIEKKEEIILEYRQKFNDYIMQNNIVKITIDNEGKIEININYTEPVYYTTKHSEVYSSIEALYILMGYINGIFEDKEVFIRNMDLVYVNNINDSQLATPYYRFDISEINSYLFIDAKEGTILEIE